MYDVFTINTDTHRTFSYEVIIYTYIREKKMIKQLEEWQNKNPSKWKNECSLQSMLSRDIQKRVVFFLYQQVISFSFLFLLIKLYFVLPHLHIN